MKTTLQRALLIFSLVLGLQTSVKAQKVYIPDPNFRTWLNQNFSSCMVGDSIDPSCSAVINAKYIDVSARGISNLTGIQVFVNDTLLICSGNQLTFLPALPSTLTYLDCSFNNLTNLSALPSNLTYLNCSSNQLSSLPALPSSLTFIYCGQNLLSTLPLLLPNSLKFINCVQNYITNLTALPTSLIELNIADNDLANFPTLPSSLEILYCQNNQLSNMPFLPASLTTLYCNNNNLTSLTNLPSALTIFYCNNNQLTNLPALPASLPALNCWNNLLTSLPALPSAMTYISCGGNQLTNLPSLPSSLATLYCAFNQISSLPSLPSSLIDFNCSSNQIASMPSLPGTLTTLNCNNNQLTSLPALPNSLKNLGCAYNQLTNLPTFSSSLINLGCQNNQLVSLPPLPGSMTTLNCQNNPLTCLPELNQVTTLNFSNTLVNCIPNFGVVIFSTPSLSSLPICDVFNSNGCEVYWNIAGSTYVDADTNCILGSNEEGYPIQKVYLFKNGILDQQTYTRELGNYTFNTSAFAEYKTEIDTNGLPFAVNCPNTGFYLDTISVTDSLKYNRDFALKCNGADLAVTSIYALNFRPASLRTIKIKVGDLPNLYGAICATGVCGTVSITITGACNYVSSPSYALTPNSVSGNVLTYYISDFGAISYDSTFDFNLLVDTTAVLGSQICITVNVYTKCVQELNYNNNQLSHCYTVVGSYDPNDKTAYPGTTLDISGNKWLNYTIRFQNTGTAEAEHVYITDTMSNLVDISTFTLLSYSHQPLMQIYNDGLVKFNFPNINLPDSNSNEPESHGYVQYKIRAKDSLTVGSTIDNTANIFFDFNAPVITNTTSNLLINCSIPKTILNATICGGEAYILNGQEYYNTGIYQQNILTAFGCDSVVELRLTVNTINNTITQSAGTLQTAAAATNYQWINCTTGTAIVGANTQTYNPTQSGSYSVVVDFGTCKDTSTCYYFSATGINEINANNISTLPNPFNNELTITLDKNYEGVLEVYNTLGALITSEKLQSRNATLNTSNWNAGVYILKVATNAGVVIKKVIKQ
jgi:uncharacterized repeat protein (TIGR01451 family)